MCSVSCQSSDARNTLTRPWINTLARGDRNLVSMTNVNFKPQQWMDSATSDYWLYGMPIEPELLCGFCKANFDRDTRKRLFNNFCIQVANIVYMYFFIQYDIETKEFRYDIIYW